MLHLGGQKSSSSLNSYVSGLWGKKELQVLNLLDLTKEFKEENWGTRIKIIGFLRAGLSCSLWSGQHVDAGHYPITIRRWLAWASQKVQVHISKVPLYLQLL